MRIAINVLAVLVPLAAAAAARAEASGVRQLLSGRDFFCLLDDDGAKCWGRGVPALRHGAARMVNLWEEDACSDGRQAEPACEQAKLARYLDLDGVDRIWTGVATVCARDGGRLKCAGADEGVAATPYEGRPDHVILAASFGCAFDGRDIECWGGTGAGKWRRSGFFTDSFANFPPETARMRLAGDWVCVEGPRRTPDTNPMICAIPRTGEVKWKVGLNNTPGADREILASYGTCLAFDDGTRGLRADCFSGFQCSGSRIDTCWPGYTAEYYFKRLSGGAVRELRLASQTAWAIDDVGLSRVHVEWGIRSYTFEPRYILQGATQVAVAYDEERWPNGQYAPDSWCALVDDSVRCFRGNFRDTPYYTELLQDGLMVVSASFRLETLERSLRRTQAFVYPDKAALLEAVAKALEVRPEREARAYAVLALAPFYRFLTSDYVVRSILPWYERRLAQLARDEGLAALADVESTQASREVALRIAAAGIELLTARAGADDAAVLRALLGQLGGAIARGAGESDTRAAMARIVDERDRLERVGGAPDADGVVLMVSAVALSLSR